MPEIPDEENNCETEGIISTLAGIIGTMQANEVIKTIINSKNDLAGKMIVYNSLNSDFRKVKLTKNKYCIDECKKQK